MDALFVPLANATGASLDQIKVCHYRQSGVYLELTILTS